MSLSMLVACSRTVYVHFYSSVHAVWLRCQTYFTTPSRILWRISIGESCIGSNPSKNINGCNGYWVGNCTFQGEYLVPDHGHLFIDPVQKLISYLCQIHMLILEFLYPGEQLFNPELGVWVLNPCCCLLLCNTRLDS